MNCPDCGAYCSIESNYCSQCGKYLNNICLNCGRDLHTSDIFCPQCGVKNQVLDEKESMSLYTLDFKEAETTDEASPHSIHKKFSTPANHKKSLDIFDIEQENLGSSSPTNIVSISEMNIKKDHDNDDDISPLTSTINDAKVHWNTVIDGHPFRYATFFSYIGIWIGILISIISLFVFYEMILTYVVIIPFLIIQIFIASGLYRFNLRSYLTLMGLTWVSATLNFIAFCFSLFSASLPLIFSNLCSMIFVVLFLIYFQKRSKAYK